MSSQVNLQLQATGFDIWHLNEVGKELFNLNQHEEALANFNAAFQTAMSLDQHLQQLQQEQHRTTSLNTITDTSLPAQVGEGEDSDNRMQMLPARSLPPTSLLRPLRIQLLTHTAHSAVFRDHCEEWVSVASMKLMYNGALCHYQSQQCLNENASKLLSMAIQVSDQLERGDQYFMMQQSSDEKQDTSNSLVASVKEILFSIQVLQAKLLAETLAEPQEKHTRNAHCKEDRTRDIEECIDSFSEALLLAEELWGSQHLVLAFVYSSMGHVLMREGCLQGATFAFNAMHDIYNIPRTPTPHQSTKVLDSLSWTTSSSDHQNQYLTDLQFSITLLGDGQARRWSNGAAAA